MDGFTDDLEQFPFFAAEDMWPGACVVVDTRGGKVRHYAIEDEKYNTTSVLYPGHPGFVYSCCDANYICVDFFGLEDSEASRLWSFILDDNDEDPALRRIPAAEYYRRVEVLKGLGYQRRCPEELPELF